MFITWRNFDRPYEKERTGLVLDKLLVNEKVDIGRNGATAVAVHRYLVEELVKKQIYLIDPKLITKITEKEEEL